MYSSASRNSFHAAIVTMPIIVIYVVFNRQSVEGTAGSVK